MVGKEELLNLVRDQQITDGLRALSSDSSEEDVDVAGAIVAARKAGATPSEVLQMQAQGHNFASVLRRAEVLDSETLVDDNV